MPNANRNLQTDFNKAPYYDDYDRTKNFQRVLFRPSYPVQARELTQLQTILNEQVGRFSSSIYADGSLITGGEVSVTDTTYIKLNDSIDWDILKNLIIQKSYGSGYSVNDELIITNGKQKVIIKLDLAHNFTFQLINNVKPTGLFGNLLTQNFNVTSGASGADFEVNSKITTKDNPADDSEDDREDRPVFHVKGFTTKTSTDNSTIFGNYTTGTEFKESDELVIYHENEENEEDIYGVSLGTLESDFSGATLLASINEGIIYSNNFFVIINQQTIPIEKYNDIPTAKLGLFVQENIITEKDDETLLDNANGAPNENAPGAHRFQLKMLFEAVPFSTITNEDDDTKNDQSFYELSRVVEGATVDRQEKPKYSVLGDEMAKRIYDINGNFVIDPFKITMDNKRIFTMEIIDYDSINDRITVNITQKYNLPIEYEITESDFEDKVFEVDERPFVMESATAAGDNEFTVDLYSTYIPSYDGFTLLNKTVDVYDKDYYIVTFASGSAYVSGRRFDSPGTIKKDLEKTRTNKHLITNNTSAATISFGNYLVLNEISSNRLDLSDFDFGAEVQFHSDSAGNTLAIGSALVKQLKKGFEDTLELYYFNSSFNTRTITVDGEATAGQKAINIVEASDNGMLGATFKHNGTRYKILSVGTNQITVNIDLVSPIPDTTELTLNYNAKNIKSVQLASTNVLPISSTMESDKDEDGYNEVSVLEGGKTKLVFPITEFVGSDVSNALYRYMKTEGMDFTSGGEKLVPNLHENEILHGDSDEYYIQLNNGVVVNSDDISINTSDNKIQIIDDGTYSLGSTGGNTLVHFPVVRYNANYIPTEMKYGKMNSISTDIDSVSSGDSYVDQTNGQSRIASTEFTEPNTYQSIGLTNVIKVRGIYEMDGSGTFGKDIKHQFNIDYGQRDETVEHCSIALSPGFPLPEDDILVIVDRFILSSGASIGEQTYYTMGSYDEVYYDFLPKIKTSDNQSYDTKKIIDFRPRRTELSGLNPTWSNRSYNENVFLPHASDSNVFMGEVDYYIGRKDKVSITPDLNFKIIQGTPDEEPEPPIHEDGSLTIYDITLSPYSTVQNDLDTTVYDNLSYTMDDIAVIEQRLSELEKTVQLDKVENAVLSQDVKDNKTNTNLFKTGVFVDSFQDFKNSEITSQDFKASVDTNEGELRPSFDQFSFSLDFNEPESTAYATEDQIILPPYDDEPVSFISQTAATRTENVNPFAVMSWIGEMKLQPERDFWKDVVRKPDIINHQGKREEDWEGLPAENTSRIEWGSWDTKWSGSWWRRRRTRERTGVKTTVTSKLKRKSLGDSIVDQSEIPIMRSVPGGIKFRGKSMKPNTIVYPFFDEDNIMEYIRPGIIIGIDRDNSDAIKAFDESRIYGSATLTSSEGSETVEITAKSKSLSNIFFHLTPSNRDSQLYNHDTYTNLTIRTYNNRRRSFFHWFSNTITWYNFSESDISVVISQKMGGAYRLKTDQLGTISGIFDVPEGEFKTGTRNFKLTDVSTGDTSTSDTSAEKEFESAGLRQVKQETIVTTRVPVVKRTKVSQKRERTFRWQDPLAETFLVSGDDFNEGIYLQSIDLWVTSRDQSIPITVQIRPTDNGYPDSEKVIPFGEVKLDPEDVTIAQTPALDNYTRFTFSSPVYLKPGEYSFVIMANSINYEIYTALMGENSLDVNTGLPSNNVVNKQPFTGVMFKSQNASTWSAYQEEDIMFRLNRVNFQTGTYTAMMNTTMDKSQLAALAAHKKSDIHFNYDESGTDSKLSYNLYRINVPQIRDFENVIPPKYRMKPRKILRESDGALLDAVWKNTEVNDTFTSKETYLFEDDIIQPDTFKVEVTFGTNSNVVAPFIDGQQMNVIFVQNRIDELELNLDTDVTITNAGTGYSDDETISLVDSRTSDQIAQLLLVTESGEVTGFNYNTSGKYITDGVELTTLDDDSASGSGLEIKAQSETDPVGGPADSKYISRRLTLKSGFESEDIKITANAYRPEGTAIYAYYKVKAAEDTDLFDNKPWNLMYELSNPNEYSIEKTDYIPLEFVTYKTRSDGSIDPTTKGGTFYEYNGTTYDTFNMYAIKIVMTSEVTYRTPIIQDVGALALVTPIEPSE